MRSVHMRVYVRVYVRVRVRVRVCKSRGRQPRLLKRVKDAGDTRLGRLGLECVCVRRAAGG